MQARQPVIVGAGQMVQRPDDPREALEPLAMMLEVITKAADDSGRPSLLHSIGAIAVVQGAWSYSDPGRLIAERIGASSARTVLTTVGGNHPQTLVNEFGRRISEGQLDVAVIVGAEAIHSRRRLRAQGLRLATTEQTGVDPDEIHGSTADMVSEDEHRRRVNDTIQFYPLFDNALRRARGETIPQQRDRIARLWGWFNAVAVDNPYAWQRKPMTAEEIREPSLDNRFIGFPYTKAMNSNWYLDQAAALILCAVETAQALGVPRDRWVFPLAGTEAHDTPFVSNRLDLHSSPAIRTAGRCLFELAGTTPEEVAHVDLYSCFPSAVHIAAAELGLAEDRPLTVTGGLTFAGGPYSNYVTHSIATMVGVLRQDPGALGLVTGNGGFLTKHALGLYSATPGRGGFVAEDVQPAVDRFGARPSTAEYEGAVSIESSTVMFGRTGPERGIFACLLPDGRRAWGETADEAAMALIMTEELGGRPARLRADGVVEL